MMMMMMMMRQSLPQVDNLKDLTQEKKNRCGGKGGRNSKLQHQFLRFIRRSFHYLHMELCCNYWLFKKATAPVVAWNSRSPQKGVHWMGSSLRGYLCKARLLIKWTLVAPMKSCSSQIPSGKFYSVDFIGLPIKSTVICRKWLCQWKSGSCSLENLAAKV